MPNLTTEAGFIDIFCANLDGKYGDEVVKVNNTVSGNDDRITFKVYESNIYYGLSLKYTRTFNFPTLLTDADGGKSVHPKFYYAGDFNGDGLTDLIKVYNNVLLTYIAGNNIIPYLSDNNTYTSITDGSIAVPVNINNGNYYTRLLTLKDGIIKRYDYPRSDTKEKLLTGSVSSLGVIKKNYYQSLYTDYCNSSNYAKIYTKGSGATFPYENGISLMFFTAASEQYFNGAINENCTYSYENAVVHKQGLGFRGFAKVTAEDRIRSRSIVREFEPLRFGVPKSEESPFAKNTYNYTVDVGSNKKVQIRLNTLTAADKIRNVTVTTSYNAYDTYGNPGTVSVNYGDGVTEVIYNSYYNNTTESGYLLGFQTNITKTTTRNGQSYVERVSVVSHNSKGFPLEKRTYANGTGDANQVLYETFGHNNMGLCILKGVKSYSSSNILTTTYRYDSYGRLTGETSPLGLATSYEYNSANGILSVVKNNKNQATTYYYDDFFRMSQYLYPDGTFGSTVYSWAAAGPNGLYCIYKSELGKPWMRTYYDALGRETAASGLNHDSSEPRTERQYDSYGRLWKVSLPYMVNTGSASVWNTYYYDGYDRLTSLNEASGRTTSYSYSGTNVTETVEGIATTRKYDNSGCLKEVSDPGGTVTYNLRPDGQCSSIVAPGNVTTSFEYDSYARKKKMIDPSAGTQSFEYDTSGRVYRETDANNKTTVYLYDTYNRLKTKQLYEFTTEYKYQADGLLESEISSNATSKYYTYDTYNRIKTEMETTAGGKWLKKTHEYADSYRKSTKYTSQSGDIVTENYIYDAGHLTEIKLNNTTSIWKLNETNAFGQPTSVTTGSFSRTYSYNAYGMPTGRTAGTIQNISYSFDAAKGNLTYRKDNSRNMQENFSYDNLNRLNGYGGKGIDYNINGNINCKSDAGNFIYDVSGKPYALSGINSPTNAIPMRNQSVTYTSFHRPATLSENGYTAAFTYNGNGDRVKMELKNNGSKVYDRYYLSGRYEIDDRNVGGIKEKLYLGGDFYSAPAVYIKNGSSGWQLYYICRDYLGSITHITSSSGSLVQELSYDAWGRLRNPNNQTAYVPGSEPDLFLGRGYTGHEHLAQFGLVNMNARLYDPALGRFLSPDPFVQNPFFSQNFNRYSYCLNNPLKYTDPSGEYALIDDLIAAAIGGVVNLVVNAFQGNIHSWGQGFSYFGVGAAGTWAGLYGGPLAAGAIIGAGNNFVTQGFGASGNWNWDNIHYDQVLMSGLMGVGTSYLGGQLNGLIGPYISELTSGLGGQAIQQMVSQGLSGSVTGFALGTGMALLNGEELDNALKIGVQDAFTGLVIGSATGLANGMRSAYKDGENPWTGKAKIEVTANDLGLSTTMDRIKAGESHPHINDGSTFKNKEGILPTKSQNYYKEYVHPTSGVNGAGTQRIVIGGNKYYYYSPDHYKTFIRFKY